MNILIINQPLNNRGDESAHKALVRSLLRDYPNVWITVLFIAENKDSIRQFAVKHDRVKYRGVLLYKTKESFFKQKFYKRFLIDVCYRKWLGWCLYHNFTALWNLNPFIGFIKRLINKADVVVCAPGGICMGGFQNWSHISYLYMAKKSNKDIYYYGRSFGPFPVVTEKNKRFMEVSLELLHYFRLTAIRDLKTENLAEELGVPYITTVDTAFLETPQVRLPLQLQYILDEKYVVLVPNILIWHYAYKKVPKERIIDLFSGIINTLAVSFTNLKIVMLPQTFNYNNEIWDDIYFFKTLKKESQYSDRIIVVDDIYSSDIQQTIISNALFLIGARYHSAVFAINNAIPFIALSYEHKISGLLSTLGGESFMVDISDLSSERQIEDIQKKVSDKIHEIKVDINMTEKAKKIASACFDKFGMILNG